jgi:hypothetical protein
LRYWRKWNYISEKCSEIKTDYVWWIKKRVGNQYTVVRENMKNREIERYIGISLAYWTTTVSEKSANISTPLSNSVVILKWIPLILSKLWNFLLVTFLEVDIINPSLLLQIQWWVINKNWCIMYRLLSIGVVSFKLIPLIFSTL